MDNLITRLRAKLAQEITPLWRGIESPVSWEIAMQQAVAVTDTVKLDRAGQHLHHNADPAATLRMVAAHRKILTLHSDSDFPYDPDGSAHGAYSWQDYCNGCGRAAPCPTLLALAEGYGIEP